MQRNASTIAPDERIVFHHIPKTAGTSVITVLRSLVESDQIVWSANAEKLRSLSEDQLMRVRIYTGHLNANEIELIPDPKCLLTFLRDPGARIVSLYYFWKSMTDSFAATMLGPPIAKRLPLLEFLRCKEPIIRSHIENGMVRRFIRGRTMHADAPIIVNTPPEKLAAMAMERLRGYHFVGFQENFEDDVGAMLRSIGRLPRPVPRENQVTSRYKTDPRYQKVEREPTTPEVEAELARLTTADTIFYEMAKKERDRLRPQLS